MVKKRSSFAKMVVLMLALVMGLSLMGVGVSYWSDTLTIDATVNTGTVAIQVIDCQGSDPKISCSASGKVLTIELTNAAVDVDYYCYFGIKNMGTTPVEIQSTDAANMPSGVDVEVTDMFGMTLVGQQIDPEQTKDGKVRVRVTSASPVTTFDFTVTIEVVPWNQ